ncbi:fumarylacetoacetate hydrolase family protein [Vibrio superstes]|uniref:Fumarylacetoacetase-like C-terminal domain-containing protein n=1 Tax=Vibrio superstes NBRC 103154 TaxID=1219062 RepID=A0A511QQU8_9VIBR|nr:fumarylacetoacetate hydrolase family protein [Vibrio superstes]GEM79681.1 hypothetical protein VSU01S_19260 [Vibrio superstes NBRC 103154]
MKTKLQGKVICVALNDKQQLEHMADTFKQQPYKALPTEPVLYFKPHNTWQQGDNSIEWPTHADSLVVGASVAVIMAKQCCRVSESEAMNYVEGFALFHDFSLPETSYYRPDIKGKCIDNSASISAPILKSDVADLAALEVQTSVNGALQRTFPLSQQSRTIEQLINKISHIMTLEKGDVIAVGFAGERVELQPGDQVSSCLGNVLSLENNIEGVEA